MEWSTVGFYEVWTVLGFLPVLYVPWYGSMDRNIANIFSNISYRTIHFKPYIQEKQTTELCAITPPLLAHRTWLLKVTVQK
jgi:hypothetical protein